MADGAHHNHHTRLIYCLIYWLMQVSTMYSGWSLHGDSKCGKRRRKGKGKRAREGKRWVSERERAKRLNESSRECW